jgi:MFS superfamily sulfate permease-like transporter
MFDPKYLRNDIFAGLVVFLVSLPLCLGIALASDAPLFSGIIAGIIGGMIVTVISRSSLGVSGPAAGLAVIVAGAIGHLGYETFLLAVIIAGVIQIVAGFMRWGLISHYFPSAVIKGLLAGIGLIMILKQIPHAVGYDASWMGELEFLEEDGHNTFSELYNMLFSLQPGAIIIALLSLAILILWERPRIKQLKTIKLIPAPLIVVILGILFNEFYAAFLPNLYLGSSHLVQLPVAKSISEFASLFQLPDFSQFINWQVYEVAFILAIIASIETLLVVEATDKLDPEKRVTPTNLELKAQGVGNVIAGLIGGLPITQVIVRGAANVEAGGKTRTASFIHGLLLVLTALIIPGLLNKIPLSSLAAILLVVGFKLSRVSLYREMYRKGWWQFAPFIITVLALVFTDMLTGVIMGMAVGVFNILKYNYKSDYFLEKHSENQCTLILSEHVSFLNKASIMKALREIPDGNQITIDGSRTQFIDHDVREVINNFMINAPSKNITYEIKGIKELEPL